MNRRTFTKTAISAALLAIPRGGVMAMTNKVRLGGPVFDYSTPDEWVQAHKTLQYGAAYCPVQFDDSADLKKAYVSAAKKAGLVIAEVGAWSNPISPNADVANAALEKNIQQLALAEEIGANCCVNIAGSRGEQWDGPHPDNISQSTFDLIVERTRNIIDAVKPTRTFYTLEAMPWVLPDSPDSYLALIKAIDRKAFGVHLDPVNMINSPRRFYDTGAFIRECFQKLGPWIKNCHAKDIQLSNELTTHLSEVLPGTGGLDYAVFLQEMSKLPNNVGLMIEHLKTPEQYKAATDHILKVGKQNHIEFIS